MALRATSRELIGRDEEMARLERAVEVALLGGSAVVLLAGEAGVGKTRLVDELTRRGRERRFRVAVGRCVEFGATVWPLAPLREIVGGLVDELDDEALDLVMGPARSALSRLVPELGGERAEDPPVTGDQLCELTVRMFDRLAQRGPLLLVVEDLHWADPTTRTWFTALAVVGRVRPLLLVGTFRSDELHRRHPLRPMLAEVQRCGQCERLDVPPLNRDDTARLIDALGGAVAGRGDVDLVHDRSGGNPFFIEELVAARRAGVSGIPDALRDVVSARAGTLTDDELALLGATSVAGEAWAECLADVTGFDDLRLGTALDRLRSTALLAAGSGDTIRFRHELGREVFYDELLPGERTRLHARLAASLEARRPERVGEIARHWSAAHETRRALIASVAAGRQAMRAGAAAEAEIHFGRALDVWAAVPDPDELTQLDHPGLLLVAAIAAKHATHLDRAIELARQAVAELTDVDPMREAEAWLELRDLYRFTRRWGECLDAVDRALALIPDSPPSSARAMALAHAAIGVGYAHRPADGLAVAREAVAVAEAAGDPHVLIYAHHALHVAIWRGGDDDRALELTLVNLDRCGPHTPPELTLTVLNDICNIVAAGGRYSEVIPYIEHGVELARRSGLAGQRGTWLANYWVGALILLGRWSEAEQKVAELADLLDHPNEQGNLAGTWGLALSRQGRIDEARPLMERARAVVSSGGSDDGYCVAALVEFDAGLARYPDSAALVEEFFRPIPVNAHVEFDEHLVVAAGVAALADWAQAARTGACRPPHQPVATAHRWIENLDALERRGYRLHVEERLHRDHAEAQLARLQGRADPEPWARLADGWAGLGIRYPEAAARYRHAETLLAGTTGRAHAARHAAGQQLSAARTIAVELGAVPLRAEIDDLARRAHIPLAPSQSDASDVARPAADLGLTRRELDVLELLGRGRTNGEIGRELYISTKTASTHVSNILRKLGVANRVEAADFARRHSSNVT